jgi:hypothetical protein
LNLRPPGYEPGELPDCSTPRRDKDDSTVSVASSLPMVFWLALAAWIVLTAAGIAFAVVRGLALRRTVKTSGGALTEQIEEISRKTELVEAHLARAEEAGARLREATGRLAEARARLDVMLRATREAQAVVEAAVPFVALLRR